MSKVFHYRYLSKDEAAQLNKVGWEGLERGGRYLEVTAFADEAAVRKGWELGEYEKVAKVRSEDLDEVYFLTNSITDYWGKNDEVTVRFGSTGERSTSVGDLIQKDTGEMFLVRGCGFKQLDLRKA